MLKPFTFNRFQQAVSKARDFYRFTHQQGSAVQDYLFIRADYSLVKVMLDDILYIEGLDDYLKIHQQGKKTLVARMTMKSMVEKLPGGRFIRVHRSFIVPFSRIDRVRNKTIIIGDTEIPLGGSYEEEFFRTYAGKD